MLHVALLMLFMDLHTRVRSGLPSCPLWSNASQSSEEPRGDLTQSLQLVLRKQNATFCSGQIRSRTPRAEGDFFLSGFSQRFFPPSSFFFFVALDTLLSPRLPEETQVISAAFSAYKGSRDETIRRTAGVGGRWSQPPLSKCGTYCIGVFLLFFFFVPLFFQVTIKTSKRFGLRAACIF